MNLIGTEFHCDTRPFPWLEARDNAQETNETPGRVTLEEISREIPDADSFRTDDIVSRYLVGQSTDEAYYKTACALDAIFQTDAPSHTWTAEEANLAANNMKVLDAQLHEMQGRLSSLYWSRWCLFNRDGYCRDIAEGHDEIKALRSDLENMVKMETSQGGGIGLRYEGYNNYLLVTEVFTGSPAYHAGLRVGDKIVVINNESVAEIVGTSSEPSGKLGRLVPSHISVTIVPPSYMLSIEQDKIINASMRGIPHSTVTLGIERDKRELFEVAIQRSLDLVFSDFGFPADQLVNYPSRCSSYWDVKSPWSACRDY